MHKVLIAAAIAGLYMAGITPAAHATTWPDEQFITTLAQASIGPSSTIEALITGGHQVCAYRSQGYSQAEVVRWAYLSTDLSGYQARWFVDTAEGVYCPGYARSELV